LANAEHHPRHQRRHSSLPRLIAELLGQRLELEQHLDDAGKLSQRYERGAQIEAHVDSLPEHRRVWREMLEGGQGPREIADGLAVGRVRNGLVPGLSTELDRGVPAPALLRVIGEALHVVAQPGRVAALDTGDDGDVERAPLLLEQELVGYVP